MSARAPSVKTTTQRHLAFVFFLAIACASLVPPLKRLGISFRSDYYSHIPFIPLVSVYFLCFHGRAVFDAAKSAPLRGGFLMAAGSLLYTVGLSDPRLRLADASSVMVFSSLLFLYGSFVLLYGTHAFSRAAFPLLFLLFMVPIPGSLMERVVYFLQTGSAEVTHLIFATSGIPYFREGLVFHFPTFSIEIAKQCSGIRSSLALAVTTVLAGHLFLQAGWQKIVLAFCILPLVLIKNGIRISVLTFLGMYVDQRILVDGFLHRSGGVFFFIPTLVLMAVVVGVLRKMNRNAFRVPRRSPSAVTPVRGSQWQQTTSDRGDH
jgi:exosortase